jgi:hypothetical protein
MNIAVPKNVRYRFRTDGSFRFINYRANAATMIRGRTSEPKLEVVHRTSDASRRDCLALSDRSGDESDSLVIALAAQACAKGYRVRFIRTTERVTALIEARDERTFLDLKGQFAKLDLWVPRTHPPSSRGQPVLVDEPAQTIGSS